MQRTLDRRLRPLSCRPQAALPHGRSLRGTARPPQLLDHNVQRLPVHVLHGVVVNAAFAPHVENGTRCSDGGVAPRPAPRLNLSICLWSSTAAKGKTFRATRRSNETWRAS